MYIIRLHPCVCCINGKPLTLDPIRIAWQTHRCWIPRAHLYRCRCPCCKQFHCPIPIAECQVRHLCNLLISIKYRSVANWPKHTATIQNQKRWKNKMNAFKRFIALIADSTDRLRWREKCWLGTIMTVRNNRFQSIELIGLGQFFNLVPFDCTQVLLGQLKCACIYARYRHIAAQRKYIRIVFVQCMI